MSTRRSSLRRSLRRGRRAVQPELSALSLPKLDRVFYIPNRYDAATGKFIDRDGKHIGTPQLLQYASIAAPVTLYHASIVGTETANNQGTASVSFAAGSITIGAGTAWHIVDSVGHVWEFCSALSSTSVVMWDVSGNGAHLVGGGLDSGVVAALCSSGREYGSNHLNVSGWLQSDSSGATVFDRGMIPVPSGIKIPAYDSLSSAAYSVDAAQTYTITDTDELYTFTGWVI